MRGNSNIVAEITPKYLISVVYKTSVFADPPGQPVIHISDNNYGKMMIAGEVLNMRCDAIGGNPTRYDHLVER